MIKKNQKIINCLVSVFEFIVVACVYLFTYFFRFESGIFPSIDHLPFESYIKLLTLILPLLLILQYAFSMYKPMRNKKFIVEVVAILKSNSVLFVVLISILFFTKNIDISRTYLLIFTLFNIISQITLRGCYRFAIKLVRIKGYNVKHIVIVGVCDLTDEYVKQISGHNEYGYIIEGYFDDNINEYNNIPYLGKLNMLQEFLNMNKIDEVIISLNLSEYECLPAILTVCETEGVKSFMLPVYSKYVSAKSEIEYINDVPIINTRQIPLDNLLNSAVKRAFDIVISFALLVMLSPVFLICSILVKATSKGEIIFSNIRVGKNKEEFKIYKFRTMKKQPTSQSDVTWTVENDKRVTKVGKFLRKTSIDELPQLINVLKGEMSLIGPRPERPFFVEKFKDEIPKYMVKHFVRPGITGLAQVKGFRGDTSIKKRIEWDIYYIENWSILLDIQIFFLTFKEIFKGENAY